MIAPTEGTLPGSAPHRAGPGLPWLVADVGGTNARFGWVADAAKGVQHIRKLPTADHAGPAQAASAYLAELSRDLGGAAATPRRAAMAVAMTVDGDDMEMTNSHWRFSRSALARELGVQTLLVLNDFEALALSLPRLHGEQLRSVGPFAAHARAQGTLAVIGPGTGLGVAGVVQTPQGWVALPGEGGHATLAPGDDYESRILQHVRQTHDHVSAERLLSGIGLPALYDAVATVLGHNVPALTAEVIVERGVSGSDALCRRTLDTFCALLGSFAGNVALTLGARGGVYIGGGIVPRFGERFFASEFRERFEAKGRFRGYLETIPTVLIIDTLAALTGAALALEQHEL
jgi:glucokinase